MFSLSLRFAVCIFVCVRPTQAPAFGGQTGRQTGLHRGYPSSASLISSQTDHINLGHGFEHLVLHIIYIYVCLQYVFTGFRWFPVLSIVFPSKIISKAAKHESKSTLRQLYCQFTHLNLISLYSVHIERANFAFCTLHNITYFCFLYNCSLI